MATTTKEECWACKRTFDIDELRADLRCAECDDADCDEQTCTHAEEAHHKEDSAEFTASVARRLAKKGLL